MTTHDASAHTHGSAENDALPARIAHAWEHGTLWTSGALLAPGPEPAAIRRTGGTAEVTRLGSGETFTAWHLLPPHGTDLTVRIPWHEVTHPLRHEFAALLHAPPGVGPIPVACQEDPRRSPLGVSYLVTSTVAGRILPPRAWTREHLLAHARRLAMLHAVRAPGRGPVGLGTDRWADVEPGPMSLVRVLDADFQATDPRIVARFDLGPLMAAAREFCAARDDAFGRIDGFVLSHGDLCATNVVWPEALPGEPAAAPDTHAAPGYIDFEWAQADDPARDLAIIGGAVHGGPWYVPMDDETIDAFIAEYAAAGAAHAGVDPHTPIDAAALRVRRDAWEVYEKTAMAAHLAGTIASDTSAGRAPRHTDAFEGIRAGLMRVLGIR